MSALRQAKSYFRLRLGAAWHMEERFSGLADCHLLVANC